MAWELAEGCISEIMSYLQTNIADKLDALDAEYSDSVTLEDFAEFITNEKRVENIPGYPALVALVTEDSLVQASFSFMESELILTLVVIVLDQESSTIRTRIYRYARAILESVMEGVQAGSITWTPRFAGNSLIRYSPIYTDNVQFMQDATIQFQMWKRET